MVEYTYDEAVTLLESNLATALEKKVRDRDREKEREREREREREYNMQGGMKEMAPVYRRIFPVRKRPNRVFVSCTAVYACSDDVWQLQFTFPPLHKILLLCRLLLFLFGGSGISPEQASHAYLSIADIFVYPVGSYFPLILPERL